MGFLHRHDGPGGTRYRMREKIFAIGDDFWIETGDGEGAFKVNGRALNARASAARRRAAEEARLLGRELLVGQCP